MDRRDYYDDMYIEGNAVRKRQAVPKKAPVPERTREQIKRDRDRRLSAKRNQQHAMAINLGYVLFLMAATVVCCAVCIMFIRLQSDITTHMKAITGIETQLEELRSENAALQNRIETMITLDQIKERAAGLGLVYPDSEQVYTYSVPDTDYMNQYGEVVSK